MALPSFGRTAGRPPWPGPRSVVTASTVAVTTVLRSIVPGSRRRCRRRNGRCPPPTGPVRLADSPRDLRVSVVIGHFWRPIRTGTDLVQIIRYRNKIDHHAAQRDKCNYFTSFPAGYSEAHPVNRACRFNNDKMKKSVFFTR